MHTLNDYVDLDVYNPLNAWTDSIAKHFFVKYLKNVYPHWVEDAETNMGIIIDDNTRFDPSVIEEFKLSEMNSISEDIDTLVDKVCDDIVDSESEFFDITGNNLYKVVSSFCWYLIRLNKIVWEPNEIINLMELELSSNSGYNHYVNGLTSA